MPAGGGFAANGSGPVILTLDIIMSRTTTIAASSLVVLVAYGCGTDAIAPPATGLVVVEASAEVSKPRSPVAAALVVVSRSARGCPRNTRLLMEGGTRRFDVQLTKSDSEGRFQLSSGHYDSECRAGLEVQVTTFVPGFKATSTDSLEVVVLPVEPSIERARELAWQIQSVGFAIKGSEAAICAQMEAEFTKYTGAVLDAWSTELDRNNVCAKEKAKA